MKQGLKWGLAAVALAIALPVGCSLVGTTASVTTAPGRVVQKTLQTDNIISTYEGFFRQKASFDARVGQIAEHQKVMGEVKDDAAELQRLRVELSAMRQSCRELATGYNASSAMANKALFKDGSLPAALSEIKCDA